MDEHTAQVLFMICITTSLDVGSSVTADSTQVTPKVQQCTTGWSSWINTDTPASGDGDREGWTAAEKLAFCPVGGNITAIECKTTTDIPFESAGEIALCEISEGAICLTADNFPLPCNDYMIRYKCTCDTVQTPPLVSGPPTVPVSTTAKPHQYVGSPVTAGSTQVTPTVQRWSSWINTDTPASGDGDREVKGWTAAEKLAFCPAGGNITAIECKTTTDIPFESAGEIAICEISEGAICLTADNDPIPCSDYMIRYKCTFDPLCTPGWSTWINRDKPGTTDGDRETMTTEELTAFCPGGNISSIECRTTTDISSESAGEIMLCTVEGGSVCLNDDNFPMPCSDYKIRYQCACETSSTTVTSVQLTTSTPYTATLHPQCKRNHDNGTCAVCSAEKWWILGISILLLFV